MYYHVKYVANIKILGWKMALFSPRGPIILLKIHNWLVEKRMVMKLFEFLCLENFYHNFE